MVGRRIHRVYVRAHGDIVGVISTRDVMLAIRDVRLNKPIDAFMSSPVFTVRASEPISLAAERLEKAHVSGLIAVDEHGWPVGVFAQEEALASRERPRETPVEDAMSPAVLVMPPRTALHRAAAQAAITRVRRIVAVDGADIRGILTGLDFARAAAA
jgi:CBS domain-containing protein